MTGHCPSKIYKQVPERYMKDFRFAMSGALYMAHCTFFIKMNLKNPTIWIAKNMDKFMENDNYWKREKN